MSIVDIYITCRSRYVVCGQFLSKLIYFATDFVPGLVHWIPTSLIRFSLLLLNPNWLEHRNSESYTQTYPLLFSYFKSKIGQICVAINCMPANTEFLASGRKVLRSGDSIMHSKEFMGCCHLTIQNLINTYTTFILMNLILGIYVYGLISPI